MFRAEQDDNFNSGLQLDRSRFFLQLKHCSCPMDKASHCGEGHWKVKWDWLLLREPGSVGRCRASSLLTIMVPQPYDHVANPKLFMYKEKVSMFSNKLKHIPGKKNVGAALM